MNWVDKVNESLDYIEDHLLEELTAEAVGRAVHYAPAALQSLFGAITGYTIGEYIRFRRLSQAVKALAAGKLSVTEAALEYRYETPEAFSKAFKRLFGMSPGKVDPAALQPFARIRVQAHVTGGFDMTRNLIPGLQKVDWSDTSRQNEYVNSVVSALNALGEHLTYDYVCAVSGSAFRTSFSMPSSQLWNHGNYHVINTPDILPHTFTMLGYMMFDIDLRDGDGAMKKIRDSIDQGVPVITVEGVINCADACVISGYDHNGKILLGYSPFAEIEDDHKELPDESGYFRKTDWLPVSAYLNSLQAGAPGIPPEENQLRVLIVIAKVPYQPTQEQIFTDTLKLAKKLILSENLARGQYNGLAAHRAFANALMTYEWEDNGGPYLNVMCNYKQYLDRQYAVPFLRQNGREDLAAIYEEIAGLASLMSKQIPQDFSAGDLFGDKANLKPFCDTVLQICGLEEKAAGMM